ncbi:hypothetical protein IGI04_026506 [Brassica rapa subsp. trilocularis]|uniref:Uncharacterized protein n=1 Tax=Brassica rapa subsp. trilocularis TaxID=1813537 RepID=A0ABQ7KWH8_BRACM|nr:hypothetical protein IGI04_026506 [Brassica rapa subsp. trilocularis]
MRGGGGRRKDRSMEERKEEWRERPGKGGEERKSRRECSKLELALPPAWTAHDSAYQRPESSPSSIVLLALLPPLHQISCLRYARSRGLGFDASECSAAEALLLRWYLRLSVAQTSRMRGCFSPSSSGRVALLLRVNGGSPLQIQEVVRLGIEFWGSRCFVELRLSPYWHGVCRRVVSLSTQSGWCSSSVAGSRKVMSSSVGIGCKLAHVLHSILVGASDGFSSSSFSSSVLDGYERVVVLVSLTVTISVRSPLTCQHYLGLLEPLVVVCEAIVCRCFEVIDELFSGGPLSLRADSSGRPNLPGSNSRLNLVHLFAASCWLI